MIILHPVNLAFRRVDEACVLICRPAVRHGWRDMVPVLAGLPICLSQPEQGFYRSGQGGSRVCT